MKGLLKKKSIKHLIRFVNNKDQNRKCRKNALPILFVKKKYCYLKIIFLSNTVSINILYVHKNNFTV